MENFLLCGELSIPQDQQTYLTPQLHCGVYKGRKRGTVEFVGIWKYDKKEKAYIENGVQIMHSLDNNNVLKFVEWYEAPQHIWVITELTVGGSLKDMLEQDGFIPLSEIPNFLKDITTGLSYIHSKGIIYCDLQASKVVLDSCQNLKLSDFTLSRPVDDCQNLYNFKSIATTVIQSNKAASPPTSTLSHAPSPFYCAPELFEHCTNFSVATDLWSLGCLVYELAVGSKPFDDDEPENLVHAICFGDMNLISSRLQTLQDINKLVTQLLSRTPSDRCKCMHDQLSC